MDLFAYDFLTFVETIKSRPFAVSTSDILIFHQLGRTQIYNVSAHDIFNVGNSLSYRTSIYHTSTVDFYEVHQQGAKGQIETINEGLFVWDTAQSVKYDPRIDNLNLTHTISFVKSKTNNDNLAFLDNVTFTGIYNRGCSDDYNLINSTNQFILDKYSLGITVTPFTGPNAPEC